MNTTLRVNLSFDVTTGRLDVTSGDQNTVDWFEANPSAAQVLGALLARRVGCHISEHGAELEDLRAQIARALRSRFPSERFVVRC